MRIFLNGQLIAFYFIQFIITMKNICFYLYKILLKDIFQFYYSSSCDLVPSAMNVYPKPHSALWYFFQLPLDVALAAMLNKNFPDASKDSEDDSSKVFLFSFKSAFMIFFLIFFNDNRFFMIKHVKNYKKNVKKFI